MDQPQLSEEMLEKSGVNPSFTSYQLSMEEYDRLCHAYNDICKRIPAIFEYDFRATPKQRLLQSNTVAYQVKENILLPTSEDGG